MGCAQSKVDNEEVVKRCKERRQWMKSAVAARNAFAAAHSSYAVALKNAGAALSEFGQGEVPESGFPSSPSSSSTAAAVPADGEASGPIAAGAAAAASAAVQPHTDTLLPPPPPPPPPPSTEFSFSPMQRSVSVPSLPKKLPTKIQPDATIREEDEDAGEEVSENEDGGGPNRSRRHVQFAAGSPSPSPSRAPPPLPPRQPSPTPLMPESKNTETWDYFFSMDHTISGPSLSPVDEIQPETEVAPEKNLKPSVPQTPSADRRNVISGGDVPVTPKKVVVEAPLPPKVPRKSKQGGSVHHKHAASASAVDEKRGMIVPATRPSNSLVKVLMELDDLFLKASESTHEVSKMLEATRMHYHSNFADSRGHIDHSARVMRVITWNRSLKGVSGAEGTDDDFEEDDEKWETHATVLDKILAWEKKLYEEVKAGELIKIEYQRKAALLNRQKKHGANTETLQRTKAVVSHLHTRYIVDMQSMDSTVSEIQHLRDKRLFPKLVQHVKGMARMWQAMRTHHYAQLKIAEDLKAMDISTAPKETSEEHYKRTLQLLDIVKGWHSQFQKVVSHQKEYVNALNSWLKLNLSPIESSLKESVSSPQKPAHAPIQTLLHAWRDYLEKLPDEVASRAIFSFSEVINTIVTLQDDELKQKDRCEELHREHLRKNRAFEDWYHKYSNKRMGDDVGGPESEGATQKDPVEEKRFAVQSLKSTLDGEVEARRSLCKQVREKSVSSLKTYLPELFRPVSEFADFCARMYASLELITEQNPPTD